MSAGHRSSESRRHGLLGRAAVIVALGLGSMAVAAPALAAKGAGAAKNSGSSTLTLVLLDSTDGVPHWGQQITWDVSTTATTAPHVSVTCDQGGVVVYSAQSGYYPSYPWPSTQDMTLSSQSWTGGDADCTASLYYFDGRKTVTLKTLDFHVYA
ncbi:MAG TPA: hypothetical protein VFT62_05450 [Mycobacteriales bacterium]|nr:hypothetical protein [Mycobacteriales bacterium]